MTYTLLLSLILFKFLNTHVNGSNLQIWKQLDTCQTCAAHNTYITYMVDLSKKGAKNDTLVSAVGNWIETNVDELHFIAQDKSTDLGVNLRVEEAMIVDDRIVTPFIRPFARQSLKRTIVGSDILQLKTQIELAERLWSESPNVELITFAITDKFPMNKSSPGFPCPHYQGKRLPSEIVFIDLNDNLQGLNHLDCLFQNPIKNHHYSMKAKITITSRSQIPDPADSTLTLSASASRILYAHVCGVDMCKVGVPLFDANAPTASKALANVDAIKKWSVELNPKMSGLFVHSIAIPFRALPSYVKLTAHLYEVVGNQTNRLASSSTFQSAGGQGEKEYKFEFDSTYQKLVFLKAKVRYGIEIVFVLPAGVKGQTLSQFRTVERGSLSSDLTEYFENVKWNYGLLPNIRALITTGNADIFAKLQFGTRFDPFTDGQNPSSKTRPVGTASPTTLDCNSIQKANSYDKTCTRVHLTGLGWKLEFIEALYKYNSLKDETIVVYEVSALKKGLHTVRLQLPCDCLIHGCELMTLVKEANGNTTIANGQLLSTVWMRKGDSRKWSMVLKGYVPMSQGAFAVYGTRYCGSGAVHVPQLCLCWGPYSQYSKCNVNCGLGKQSRARLCNQRCEYAKGKSSFKNHTLGKIFPESTCKAMLGGSPANSADSTDDDEYNKSVYNEWKSKHGCHGGRVQTRTCSPECCTCKEWAPFGAWSLCEPYWNLFIRTRHRKCLDIPAFNISQYCRQNGPTEKQLCGVSAVNANTKQPKSWWYTTTKVTTTSATTTTTTTTSPTKNPTPNPTKRPTEEPTKSPTENPTRSSQAPETNPPSKTTEFPTQGSSTTTIRPTHSKSPTRNPTVPPTKKTTTKTPTKFPTEHPTVHPTETPTRPQSTGNPTENPTGNPTTKPTPPVLTGSPTASPTTTLKPTTSPSVTTKEPEKTPSPTKNPVKEPTVSPTPVPTAPPTASKVNCTFVFVNATDHLQGPTQRHPTFNESENICRQLFPGGHLASIHNDAENVEVFGKCTNGTKNIPDTANCWIGAHKIVSESVFQWTDSTPPNYWKWNSNAEMKDCAVITVDQAVHESWFTLPCQGPTRSVGGFVCRFCETRAPTTTTVAPTRITVFPTQMTAFPTKATTLPTQASNSPTRITMFPTRTQSQSPTKSPSSDSDDTASPTAAPTGATTSSTSTTTKVPTRNPTGMPTSSMHPSVNPTNMPSTTSTTNPSKQPSMNPTSKPSSSPTAIPTREPTQADCEYRYVDASAQGQWEGGSKSPNWNESELYCQARFPKGHLASIQNAEENQQAFNLCKNRNGTTNSTVDGCCCWIGINDIKNESHFVWSDGRSVQYTAWNAGDQSAPPSVQNSQDCGVISTLRNIHHNNSWFDRECKNTIGIKGFVCRYCTTHAPTPVTRFPTRHPSTRNPSKVPTRVPTSNPTKNPSKFPTKLTTKSPTTSDSTDAPTLYPTKHPVSTQNPTKFPSVNPTTTTTTTSTTTGATTSTASTTSSSASTTSATTTTATATSTTSSTTGTTSTSTSSASTTGTSSTTSALSTTSSTGSTTGASTTSTASTTSSTTSTTGVSTTSSASSTSATSSTTLSTTGSTTSSTAISPTKNPSKNPSTSPSIVPSSPPTRSPTSSDSTDSPTVNPTQNPSRVTRSPTGFSRVPTARSQPPTKPGETWQPTSMTRTPTRVPTRPPSRSGSTTTPPRTTRSPTKSPVWWTRPTAKPTPKVPWWSANRCTPGWSSWSAWGQCYTQKKCGYGLQKRTRTCRHCQHIYPYGHYHHYHHHYYYYNPYPPQYYRYTRDGRDYRDSLDFYYNFWKTHHKANQSPAKKHARRLMSYGGYPHYQHPSCRGQPQDYQFCFDCSGCKTDTEKKHCEAMKNL